MCHAVNINDRKKHQWVDNGYITAAAPAVAVAAAVTVVVGAKAVAPARVWHIAAKY